MFVLKKFVVALAFVATGLCSPVSRQNTQYVDVIVQKLGAVAKDITAYKQTIQKFPSRGSSENELRALKAISAASNKIVTALQDKDLWDAIDPPSEGTDWYSFTNEEEDEIANALTPVIQPDFKAAGLALRDLEPKVKKLGCYDLLNSVYADFTTLLDNWYKVMNWLAVYHVPGDPNDKATANIYDDINRVLQATQGAYQVGPNPGFGDEPTDGCKA